MAANNAPFQNSKRVVLLAREGKARDKLKQTLAGIGAELVLEADPNAVDAASLNSARPQALLIALEPAVEAALDKLGTAIGDGGYAVIFDDAEVAAQREGWDAQRWSRHLAAKLHGHADVLPPGREEDDPNFVPPAPQRAAGSGNAPAPKEETIDFDRFSLNLDDDAASGLGAVAQATTHEAEFDLSGLESASFDGVPSPAKDDASSFDFGALSFDDDAASGIAAAKPAAKADNEFASFDFGEIDLDALDAEPPAPQTQEYAGLDLSSLDFVAEEVSLPEVSAPTAPSDSGSLDFSSLSLDTGDLPAPTPVAEAPKPAPSFSFGDLSLEEIEPPAEEAKPTSRLLIGDEPPEDWAPPGEAPARPDAPASVEPPASPAFGRATFGLVEDEPAAPATPKAAAPGVPGAVLLFAGMGGPDAVRRVLADLPKNFRRPVFVRQHLDGGSYVNLVKQLERVATMPVVLAEAGNAPSAGTIYVVPNDVSIELNFGTLGFGAGQTDYAGLIPGLPPADSAVLLLSGADKALVEPAHALSVNGAFVAGQSAQNCYDPAAARALADHGCASGTPNELAAKLAALW